MEHTKFVKGSFWLYHGQVVKIVQLKVTNQVSFRYLTDENQYLFETNPLELVEINQKTAQVLYGVSKKAG